MDDIYSSTLLPTFERLIESIDLNFKRYLFHTFKIGRLIGLIGPRGVGKTTLMLQYIKQHFGSDAKAFYFSADSVYFHQLNLFAFVQNLYRLEGYRVFFIDEVHKYTNWNQELKNLYDAFPDIQLIYSGSSMLELSKGSYDLSRRASVHHLSGLSFREYLALTTDSTHHPIVLSNLLENPKKYNRLGRIENVLHAFRDYLVMGYYPFFREDKAGYHERVFRVIEKIIYEDIPNYFDLKTQNLPIFKRLIGFLASIVPGEVNTHTIAQNLQISHQTIAHYLSILESVGLIQMIYVDTGGNKGLRKPQKIFLHNTNLLYALKSLTGKSIEVGTVRELAFIQMLRDSGQAVHYTKVGDYVSLNHTFEIGGKNKSRKQIAEIPDNAYLVKADQLSATTGTIPLHFFGFLF